MKKGSAPASRAKQGTTSRIRGHDPESPAEWQEAVDTAHFLLLLDSARQYGLVEGGPAVDIERCEAILKRGAEMRYRRPK
jgi:hypothetical protein